MCCSMVGFFFTGISAAAGGLVLGLSFAFLSCRSVALAKRSWAYLAQRWIVKVSLISS